MVLIDVNVMVYAHRQDVPNHAAFRTWLEAVMQSDEAYGMSDLVLAGFLRVVTHPRVFKTPTPINQALAFARDVRDQPNCLVIEPGPRHWDIFARLCKTAGVRGNLVPDAYFAALAIESGCEWVTTDRDYSRFAGLRWRLPVA